MINPSNFLGSLQFFHHVEVNVKERGAIMQRMLSEIFPEYILIRVNEFNKVAKTPLDEWMEYLKEGKIHPDTTAPGLNEAREKLKYYSMTPKERKAYDEHLSAVMIQNDVLDTAKLEGRIEGRAEDRAEEKLENAKRMKDKGCELDFIAEITGLSLAEIEQL